MDGYSFTREAIAALWPELLPLAVDHWRELHPDGPPANLNQALLENADSVGSYRVYTVRRTADPDDQALVGYAAFWISRHPHCTNRVEAAQDGIYIVPQYRQARLARFLIDQSDRALACLGVDSVTQRSPVRADFGPVLLAMGYEPIETTWERRLSRAT